MNVAPTMRSFALAIVLLSVLCSGVVLRTNAAAIRSAPAVVAASAVPASDPALSADDSSNSRSSRAAEDKADTDAVGGDLRAEASSRHNKMLDYFNAFGGGGAAAAGYFAPAAAFYPQPYQQTYYTPSFYDPATMFGGSPFGLPADGGSASEDDADDNNNNNVDIDDLMARANRRRPGGGGVSASNSGQQNSPIFYIRLPPTPYMYVPGMGYISQPPTIRPMSQQFAPQALPPPPPPPPPQQHQQHIHPQHQSPLNPFINVPVSFLANGKPTNVYEWSPHAAATAAVGSPQYPSYLPARPLQPHRPPGYRPISNKQQPAWATSDSKITHLKGPYIFNGRPEEIFVLPSSGGIGPYGPYQQQPLQQQQQQLHHYQTSNVGGGYHSQQQQPHYSGYHNQHLTPVPFGADGGGYNPYANGLFGYY